MKHFTVSVPEEFDYYQQSTVKFLPYMLKTWTSDLLFLIHSSHFSKTQDKFSAIYQNQVRYLS
jgi:hypothetical protein